MTTTIIHNKLRFFFAMFIFIEKYLGVKNTVSFRFFLLTIPKSLSFWQLAWTRVSTYTCILHDNGALLFYSFIRVVTSCVSMRKRRNNLNYKKKSLAICSLRVNNDFHASAPPLSRILRFLFFHFY